MGVMLCAMFAVAATIPTAGQIAAGIHLVDVRFNGDARLDGVDLRECATDLKSHIYAGTQWADYLVERVRTQCLLDKGYVKASVKASTRQLPDNHSTHQFVITFDIDAGPRYRLGEITFRNNHAISSAKALRGLFPIKDGDIFDRNEIAKGFENLRYAYEELGYINFTSVPSPRFNDEKKLGSLEIDVDEGKQFYVSSIDIVGSDPQVLNDLLLTPGHVYNVRLVDSFLRRHLPGTDVYDPRIQQRLLDERNGTVALTFDFSRGPK
jgi:outer membrane translocation and assembly module TamA